MDAPKPSHGAEQPGAPSLLDGIEWRLQAFGDPGTGPDPGTGLVAVPAGVMATATFTDGLVAGSTGCNRYHGTCRLDGDRLAVGPVAMTMMACDPERTAVERAFTAGLAASSAFAVTGDALDLLDAEGQVLLRFRAAPALPLVGTTWVATMINNGRGGVVGVLDGVDATASFGDGGRLSGSGGCNRYSGSYVLDDGGLAIGPLATTRMACSDPEGIGEHEAAFFAALGRVATWSVREGRLELRAADGALQVELQPAH